MPDVQELPRATNPMPREEVSALGSARREEIRRQIELSDRLKANPLLYLVSPQVKVRYDFAFCFFLLFLFFFHFRFFFSVSVLIFDFFFAAFNNKDCFLFFFFLAMCVRVCGKCLLFFYIFDVQSYVVLTASE